MKLNISRNTIFTLLVGLLAVVIGIPNYDLSISEALGQEASVEVIAFADFVPQKDKEDCPVLVHVMGLVDLARPLEVHCKSSGPQVDCESVTGQLWVIDEYVEARYKEPDTSILARVKGPAPDRLIVGEWLNYDLTVKKNPKCQPEEPDNTPIPDRPRPPKKPHPDGQEKN